MCFAEWTAINQTFLLQEVGLSITSLSLPPSLPPLLSQQALNLFILHAQVQPWISSKHFFLCSYEMSESYVQIRFHRTCVWLAEVGHLSVTLEEWARECFTSTQLTVRYLFMGYAINHWAVQISLLLQSQAEILKKGQNGKASCWATLLLITSFLCIIVLYETFL